MVASRLFCGLSERAEFGFGDLEDDARITVGDFADLILGGDAEELGDLGWGELVVLFEPVGHVAGSLFDGVVERASEAHGDEIG
jgi:hypothetical protein